MIEFSGPQLVAGCFIVGFAVLIYSGACNVELGARGKPKKDHSKCPSFLRVCVPCCAHAAGVCV